MSLTEIGFRAKLNLIHHCLEPTDFRNQFTTMASWIEANTGSGFTLDVLPYGIFSTATLDKRIGVAIGDYILDMKAIVQEGLFGALDMDKRILEEGNLNAFAATGRETHKAVRDHLQNLLTRDTSIGKDLRDHTERRERVFINMSEATMHVPMNIGDYTDFFVGIHHAQNVGLTHHSPFNQTSC